MAVGAGEDRHGAGGVEAHLRRFVQTGPGARRARPARHLDAAPGGQPVFAERAGVVAAIDVRAVGIAVVALGGGRTKTTDPIDFAVGLADVAGLGASVGPAERPLAVVHARSAAQAKDAAALLRRAFTVADPAPSAGPLIADRIRL
ncbi:hypothetical protein GAY28_33750 [Azospirillum brasilense]|nr:hypothetical protein [Azospirillum brasilense]